MPSNFQTEWTAAEENLLRELCRTERRVAAVAERMGKTRSAIIGKIRRMSATDKVETNWLYTTAKGRKRRRLPGEPEPVAQAQPKKPRPAIPNTVVTPPKVQAFTPAPERMFPMRRLSLLQLGHGHCRWPVGDPGTPGFFFCGNDVFLRSYCPVHYRVAYLATGRRV